MWHESGHRAEVTCIVQSPHKTTFAVGYMDGSIRLWDSETGTSTVVLNGHKKAVTTMCFDLSGQRLASGSQDTDIIVWDVVGETGLYRYATWMLHRVPRLTSLPDYAVTGIKSLGCAFCKMGRLAMMPVRRHRTGVLRPLRFLSPVLKIRL